MALTLRVLQMRWEADDVVSLLLTTIDGRTLPPWSPGDHIDIRLPGGLVRQYSLCGERAPGAPWRIAVLRVPDGRGGSAAVHDRVRQGDLLQTSLPRSNFELRGADSYVFLAGGIGITPILPMVHCAQDQGVPWELHYGGRSLERMPFTTELAPSATDGRVTLVPQDTDGLLSLPPILREIRSNALIYACGPPAMLDALQHAAAHWPDQSVVIERFGAVPLVDGAGPTGGHFEVEAAQSGVTVRVGPGTSVVEALGEAGVNVPTSCGQGICGTCETKILAGIPDHHDSLLTEAERASNQTMMVCVSRSLSDRLVLDL